MSGNDGFTQLLLHCDGANGSTLFSDSSPNAFAVTANGNAQISTAQTEFGTGSASFDGTNSYLSIADAPGLRLIGDLTIDFWIRPHTFATVSNPIIKDNPSGVGPYLIDIDTGGGMTFYSSSNGSTYDIASGQSLSSLTLDTWSHVAVVRQGSTFWLFNNGVQTATFSSSLAFMQTADPVIMGRRPAISSRWLNGFIDEMRLSSVARWTANFTPPVRPYTPDGAGLSFPGPSHYAPAIRLGPRVVTY